MNRLDFHSVATLLQKHLIETADMTQVIFISTLFSCFVNDCDFSFDEGLCCKWIKGQAKLSPKIISYYQIQKHKEEMYADMEEELFLQISDIGALATDLYNLLETDASISELQRNKLLQYYDSNDITQIAQFVSEVLIFAMSRPFVKANLKINNASPSVEDRILTTTIPKPVKTYVEAGNSLSALHNILSIHDTVFIRGIRGIGKSELIKAYCKQHKKNYTNILFLSYSDSLYEMIVDMDFIDDNDSLTEKERFRRHFRFLKTLQNDSLIVIDNFDNTNDDLLPQICDLKCKTVFTTHNAIENQTQYTVFPNPSQAQAIFQLHCTDCSLYTKEEMQLLLEALHYHPMSVEMIARLLSYTNISPDELLHRLKENVFLQQENSKLPVTKDNHTHKNYYYMHMETLLDMHKLTPKTQAVLSAIALAPENGFPLRLFYQWYGSVVNEINTLSEYGFIEIYKQHLIIHPYIRKLINARQMIHLSDTTDFFNQIIICLSDETSEHHHLALGIVNTSLRFIKKDEPTLWKRITTHALETATRLHSYRIFQKLLREYEGMCYLYDNITNEDKALLLHYIATEKAYIHQNYSQAIELEEKAIAEACNKGTSQILNLSSFYMDASNYYSKLQKPDKAFDNIQKATDVLTNTQLLYTPSGLHILITYAKYLQQQNKLQKALPVYVRCIEIMNKTSETDTLTKAYLFQNLATIYSSLQNSQLAVIRYSQAEEIFKKYLDEEHPDLLLCQEQLRKELSKK